MALDLSGATDTVIAIAAQQKQPVLLYTLFLTVPTITYRYAAYISNLSFGGETFIAKTIVLDGTNQSLEGQIGKVSIKIDNTNTDLAAVANSHVFEGRRLLIQRIFLDSSGNPPSAFTDYKEVFNGKLETPSNIDKHWLSVSAVSGSALKKRTLLDTYNKPCRHVAGGERCNQDGKFDLTTSGTTLIASGNLTSKSASGTTFAGVGTLTQADDYWNFGSVTIGNSGVSYFRIVEDFDNATSGATLDLSVPVALDTSFRYVLKKGCDKLLATCTGANAWGPRTGADNNFNFGGFIHIGKNQERF